MSRPVSIGTGVCEIIGGSVQTVFAVGGILILLDPFATELRIQVHKSVHHDQPGQAHVQNCWNHLCISLYLYHSVFWCILYLSWMTHEYASRLDRLLKIVLGCLGVWKHFGNRIHQSFIKRILWTFVPCEDSKSSHEALKEEYQAQALLFFYSMQPAANRGVQDSGRNGMQNWVQSTGQCSSIQTERAGQKGHPKKEEGGGGRESPGRGWSQEEGCAGEGSERLGRSDVQELRFIPTRFLTLMLKYFFTSIQFTFWWMCWQTFSHSGAGRFSQPMAWAIWATHATWIRSCRLRCKRGWRG